ncbi:MAG: NAD(P)H-hydrate dehydratase [Kistimonas sp.]|nr:NAD(P)H-hydrate dehydratase [Kistimonas sp.]
MNNQLPIELHTAEQSRQIDARAATDASLDAFTLMQRAGQAALDTVSELWPHTRSLQILSGGGNNGGDGYAMAALAQQSGMSVELLSLVPPEKLTGAALSAWEWFRQLGGTSRPWSDASELRADLLVDAILGTGLRRAVTGQLAKAIEGLNAAQRPVLCLDTPSGLCADTGVPLGTSVQAQATVTFITLKQGLLTGMGPDFCGKLFYANLDVPSAVIAAEPPSAWRIDQHTLASLLRPRRRSAHKGDYGHLMVVGGDLGTGGAALMAAESALRAGAGRVTLVTRPEHVLPSLVRCPEIMVHGMGPEDTLDRHFAGKTAVVIGPGLGSGSWGRHLLKTVLSSSLPLVLDADALNLIADETMNLAARAPCLITPHPGEAGRLLHIPVAEVVKNRFAAVARLQASCGDTAVLKGSGTLVASTDGIHLCNLGNPGLAVAGTGDVLSGLAGALLAQGYSTSVSARLAVWLHARAGDTCAASRGETGMLATDLLPAIRAHINTLVTATSTARPAL